MATRLGSSKLDEQRRGRPRGNTGRQEENEVFNQECVTHAGIPPKGSREGVIRDICGPSVKTKLLVDITVLLARK